MTRFGKEKTVAGEHALTENQVRMLLENCPHVEEEALLSLAISSGMRRSDIVRVLVRDVNLKERKVSYKEKKKGDRTIIVGVPQKTSTSIERWLNIRNSNSKYLFPARESSSTTGHMSGRSAYNILKKNLERNGLEPRPFHSLRATCVKLCQKRGWTVGQAAKLIGDQEGTVEKHYSVPSDEEMFKLMEEKPLL